MICTSGSCSSSLLITVFPASGTLASAAATSRMVSAIALEPLLLNSREMPCLTSCSRSSSLILPRRALRASAKAGLPDSGSSALKKLSAADYMLSVAKDGCETDECDRNSGNKVRR
jgi:hypothetical protein